MNDSSLSPTVHQEVIDFQLAPEIQAHYQTEHTAESNASDAAEHVVRSYDGQVETCVMGLHRRGGRACETCALNLENRVRNLNGVQRVSASYVSGMMSVSYDTQVTSRAELEALVRELGVPVTPLPVHPPEPVSQPSLLKTLRAALENDQVEATFTAITFITMLLGLLFDGWLKLSAVGNVFYVIAYITGGTFGLKAGLESLRQRTIDVDLLMIIAAIGAALVGAPFEGVMLLFLFSLSNVLQNFALDRTRNAIRALMKLRPETALTRRGAETVVLPIADVLVGDRVIVRPGDRIPLDGAIVEGESSVDQSPITGESMPVTKRIGDDVLAGTINQEGALEVRVTRLARDSTLSRLIQLVEEAQTEKAQTQRFIDRAEQIYAAGVIVMTILAILIPIIFLREAFGPTFYRAMTLMVAASPCALVISTPATVLSAIGNGARRGVLFKGGVYVERAATIKVIAFDKTGTLTIGKPKVTDVVVSDSVTIAEGLTTDTVLQLAASAESKSEHPLAQAIVNAARERKLDLYEGTEFTSVTGMGVKSKVNGKEIHIGNQRYFERYPNIALEGVRTRAQQLEEDGKTTVIVARVDETGAGHALGLIAIADTLRPNVPAIVKKLKSLGVVRVVMLTGDHERVAHAIAAQAGVDGYHAGLLPEDKLRIIREIEAQYGPVAMVGDGVNDAPALATASIGIAMGAAGTDVALETADVVLMSDDLSNIPYVIALSHATRKTLIQNLAFALGMIVVLIFAVLGFSLALPLSVIGHEGSTVLVSLNGLRLLGYRKK
ncbi:MAG TPA: heavy metal translocating P-type ATPase [Anaerolineales bacterium]|nr:heavy metal translocating P-type ATPase [Anaerolineales bacterium]